VTASTEVAYAMCAQVLHDHGLLVGHSSGAALWAAREVAKQAPSAVVVALLPDSGERYLSAR
jgi:cysteine synthase